MATNAMAPISPSKQSTPSQPSRSSSWAALVSKNIPKATVQQTKNAKEVNPTSRPVRGTSEKYNKSKEGVKPTTIESTFSRGEAQGRKTNGVAKTRARGEARVRGGTRRRRKPKGEMGGRGAGARGAGAGGAERYSKNIKERARARASSSSLSSLAASSSVPQSSSVSALTVISKTNVLKLAERKIDHPRTTTKSIDGLSPPLPQQLTQLVNKDENIRSNCDSTSIKNSIKLMSLEETKNSNGNTQHDLINTQSSAKDRSKVVAVLAPAKILTPPPPVAQIPSQSVPVLAQIKEGKITTTSEPTAMIKTSSEAPPVTTASTAVTTKSTTIAVTKPANTANTTTSYMAAVLGSKMNKKSFSSNNHQLSNKNIGKPAAGGGKDSLVQSNGTHQNNISALTVISPTDDLKLAQTKIDEMTTNIPADANANTTTSTTTTDDTTTASVTETTTTLNHSSINAERFIPKHKKLQWDYFPSIILVCTPCQLQPGKEISLIHRWVYNPTCRRSNFDLCTFNLLNHATEGVDYMLSCLYSRMMPTFTPHILHIYRENLKGLYQHLDNHRSTVRILERKLTLFADLDTRKKHCSIQTIKAQHMRSAQHFIEDRIIQTTPETLARVCDEIQSVLESRDEMTKGFQVFMELHGCLKMVCKDYLTKINMLMDVERLQALDDLRDYDMYSCQFDYIMIPEPRDPVEDCVVCNKSKEGRKMYSTKKFCAYHTNLYHSDVYKDKDIFSYTPGRNSAKVVKSTAQFTNLSDVLTKLGSEDKIIAYLTVPGVAENRPLVCIGDLIRLRLDSEEVIAEVGEVVVKTETIMLFLPIPDKLEKSPLFETALRNPKNRPLESHDHCHSPTIGRFDVRFGLFGLRAHDIFKNTCQLAVAQSLDQVMRCLAPTPFLEKVQKKSIRRPQIGISEWANTLNSEQKHAVFDIVRKNHGQAPYCIYGPPGTGKTMTVVETVFQILRHDMFSKILICAPSDAACDVITMRLLPLLPKLFKVKRVNWWSRNPASLPPSLLQCSTMNDSGFFVLPSLKEMKEASVIVCQCFVAGVLDIPHGKEHSTPWMDSHFTHVFIDESSQSFEFESLIPLMKVGKDCSIVLAGDPKQLGPTVRSRCASRNGLSLSLQERLMGLSLYQMDTNYCVITKLLDNYRSHDALLKVPSELFYTGSLRCRASKEITSTCRDFELLYDGNNFPMMVYDVDDGVEKNKLDTPSFYNIRECDTVVKIIKALLASPNVEIHAGQIAVITCFRAQVLKLRETLRENELGAINVGTVEDFQGQETSVVLISTVLTENHDRWRKGTKSGLGFMTDPKRFNVAITRASALCVIVGKVDFLQSSGSYWTALIEHVRRNRGITGDSKFITNDGSEVYDDLDYGMDQFMERVKELNLFALGSAHEIDRYDMVMQGYYQDAPEW
eukprot:CAMPEP_0203681630 /NCGR_PEP_ID=MMETSP0090-20130426/43299_1 /ASSEMBLY_ACC=CAM_ASM_001088 /TAXON_ID=426623 /ORGANISM="Chaetoceros affinis, Strain CCMP159" /LENGTH=1407 /DNA_ID=CAMNT_0050550193 /DNA_START=193 /DNA_END=4413 /DNA_ORIENTATION=-